MRKIGVSEIEDIALGAALLGAGGGGDPYIGRLVAIGAVQKYISFLISRFSNRSQSSAMRHYSRGCENSLS